VFTDAFANSEQQKTTWMSLFLLSAPVGVLLGYILTTSLIGHGVDWEYAFYIQVMCAVPCILFFLVLPLKYVNLDSQLPGDENLMTDA
jgi:MFS family permease